MDALDFTVAKESGLRQRGELDVLFGVTYPMVNRYLKGKAYPRGKNREHIARVLGTVKALMDKGSLPFTDDKDKEYRTKAVAKIADFLNQPQTK